MVFLNAQSENIALWSDDLFYPIADIYSKTVHFLEKIPFTQEILLLGFSAVLFSWTIYTLFD